VREETHIESERLREEANETRYEMEEAIKAYEELQKTNQKLQ